MMMTIHDGLGFHVQAEVLAHQGGVVNLRLEDGDALGDGGDRIVADWILEQAQNAWIQG